MKQNKIKTSDCVGRPRRRRRISFLYKELYYKPLGQPMRGLKTIDLEADELEAMRLKNLENLNQEECAKKMNISTSTFQRILSSAYKKVSKTLVEGLAIKIKNE